MTVWEFDELHVVSDLHLGGESGHQIFDQGENFRLLLKELTEGAKRDETRSVGLVVNGDLVDFLAEPRATCFDPLGAESKLERIATDKAFQPVFDGLRGFVKRPNCTLAITLGNHDLELALPWVREALLRLLSEGDAAARGRILLAFDGSGFRCRVGGSNVLCVHGNEVDLWNVCDHEKLRRIGCDIQQGRRTDEWIPNAGTQLVIEAMNDVKKTHPFVDLLKPEREGALTTLLAIDLSLLTKLDRLASAGLRKSVDVVRRMTGFLGESVPSPDSPNGPEAALARVVGAAMPRAASSQGIDELLLEAEKDMLAGFDPVRLAGSSQGVQFLGIWSLVFHRFRRDTPSERLRKALSELQRDGSFDPDNDDDDTFRALDDLIGAGADYLISGHTHLERTLKRKEGGFYFNSGTWANLIQLTPEILKDAEAFAATYEKLRSPDRKDLEDLILRRPTVVSICAEEGGTAAHVWRAFVSDGRLAPESLFKTNS